MHFHKFHVMSGTALETLLYDYLRESRTNYYSACQYSFWNVLTFGAAKFQVDIREEGKGGCLTKRPVDVKQGKSEYVKSPLSILHSYKYIQNNLKLKSLYLPRKMSCNTA